MLVLFIWVPAQYHRKYGEIRSARPVCPGRLWVAGSRARSPLLSATVLALVPWPPTPAPRARRDADHDAGVLLLLPPRYCSGEGGTRAWASPSPLIDGLTPKELKGANITDKSRCTMRMHATAVMSLWCRVIM